MTPDKIDAAVKEAERFIKRARAARDQLKAMGSSQWHYPLPARSAAKRASLDLTRALAEMRKP